MSQIFDALIIGAGPAGTFLAHKLAKSSLNILVLEKNTTPRRKICGEYLCPLGVDLLKSEGLENQIVGGFLPLKGMLIVTPQGTEVDTNFPIKNKYHGVSVNREEFDKNLMQLARDSGAQLKTGVEVKKISQHGEMWRVDTTVGVFIARALIGADGRASMVSKTFQNDAPNPGKRVALHTLVDNKITNLRRGEMHMFSSGAYIGINPTGNNEVNLSLVLDAAELRDLGGPVAAFNHYLKLSNNLSSRFDKFNENDKISAAFPIQHRTKSILPRRNVALIGDAAGFVDPLTGEGMYIAILSASLLANEIIADLSNHLTIGKMAFINYQKRYSKILRNKIILNQVFQVLLRHPRIIELIAYFLRTQQTRADIFIGIIGNIYSPINGLLRLILNLRSSP